MNCLCCGRPITRDQYGAENEAGFQKRLARQLCRSKCVRQYGPAKPERVKPPLDATGFIYVRPEMTAREKEKTPRSEPFKAFIRRQQCLLNGGGYGPCEGDVIPHHTDSGGMSIKGSDLSCVPLCCAHHLLMDNAGKKGNGIWTRQQLGTIIVRLHDEFNRQQKDKGK